MGLVLCGQSCAHWHCSVIVGFEDKIRVSSIFYHDIQKEVPGCLIYCEKSFVCPVSVKASPLCFVASFTFLAFNFAARVPDSSCNM